MHNDDQQQKYGLSDVHPSEQIDPPELEYRPALPHSYRPNIALIGAGGISEYHLREYQKAGLNVAAICDQEIERGQARRDEFFPEADVYEEWHDIMAREDIEVVDIATPAEDRAIIIEDAIRSRKHVLSQKPFVLDLDVGEQLVALADEHGVKLAVNQNGRWAPHFSYINRVIRAGLIGEVCSIDFNVFFDHSWTEGTRYEELQHLILFDFGIHWFDIATVFMNDHLPFSVYASDSRAAHQTMKAPLLAHAVADYGETQVRFCFNGMVSHGQQDRTVVAGSSGTILSSGPSLSYQDVTVWTKKGWWEPELRGTWFTNGFIGTMAELLCAVEQNRDPLNSARRSLKSLALCFAALRSAEEAHAQVPGQIRHASIDD